MCAACVCLLNPASTHRLPRRCCGLLYLCLRSKGQSSGATTSQGCSRRSSSVADASWSGVQLTVSCRHSDPVQSGLKALLPVMVSSQYSLSYRHHPLSPGRQSRMRVALYSALQAAPHQCGLRCQTQRRCRPDSACIARARKGRGYWHWLHLCWPMAAKQAWFAHP